MVSNANSFSYFCGCANLNKQVPDICVLVIRETNSWRSPVFSTVSRVLNQLMWNHLKPDVTILRVYGLFSTRHAEPKHSKRFQEFQEWTNVWMVMRRRCQSQLQTHHFLSHLRQTSSLDEIVEFPQGRVSWKALNVFEEVLRLRLKQPSGERKGRNGWMEGWMDEWICSLTCCRCFATVWPRRSPDRLSLPPECWSPSPVTTWGRRTLSLAVACPPGSRCRRQR